MAVDIAISFRATAGYVTDPAGVTYSLGEAYPTVRGGATFGWSANLASSARNRSTSVDPRLAGILFVSNSGASRLFRIDGLSPGDVSVSLAIGDATSSQFDQHVKILDSDGATALATISADSITAGHFIDATGVDRTAADWPAANAAKTVTIAGTSIYLQAGANFGVATNTVLAHARVVQGGGGSPTIPVANLAAGLGVPGQTPVNYLF